MNAKKMIMFQIILILYMIVTFSITSNAASLDSTLQGADDFVSVGTNTEIDKTELHSASNFIYNALLGIGMVAAVIVGMVLGIKYMTSASEEKASVKETLIGYLISCCIIFGAFTMWRIVVNILN